MTAAGGASGKPPVDEGPSWRELAVTRSLDSARTRAESRVQRFMDAALELMSQGVGADVTVQQVVERSGQSLRTFYQYFDGKHELLLALFEELVASAADLLRERIAGEEGPLERLHCFVVEYHRLCRPSSGASPAGGGVPPVMAELAWLLLTTHPEEAGPAFRPLDAMLGDLLAEAAAAGVLRPTLRTRSVAGVMLEAITFNVFASTITGTPAAGGLDGGAEDLWDLLFHGMAGPVGG